MLSTAQNIFALNDEWDCLGDFNNTRTLCTRHCVLRIRCAIEQDHNLRLEMMEDLVMSQDLETIIQ